MKGAQSMTTNFRADCLPVLIGSLPLNDHAEGVRLVFEYTPEIPLWVQLPAYKEEGMISQFQPGFPGLKSEKNKSFIDTSDPSFDDDLLGFYEDYMAVKDGNTALEDSRFVLTKDTAGGFFSFTERLRALSHPPVAVKAQITGPVTFGLGLTDQNGKAVFYNEQLRDAAVKLLAQKARWQVRNLSGFGCPVILFFDEPALAGFGSSAFISISREEVFTCFEEVIEAVHEERGFAGIHVCANADWSLLLESATDIISFDAYSYFDKLVLYSDLVKRFIQSGGILAWGIVPTLNSDDIEKETTDSLVARWEEQARAIQAIGIDKSAILAQTLITPSCGTGSLSLDHAKKVLVLTRQVSDIIRKKYL
jgi:methionine synthase II (cobalamin-independent)